MPTSTDDSSHLIDLAKRYWLPVYKPRELVLDHGKGARVWDTHGRDYIDFGAGIAVNALWPRTVIATVAIGMIDGVQAAHCRQPQIVADAAHAMLIRPSRDYTGHFAIDEDILRATGMADFECYAVQPGNPLLPDFFLD